jgi:hypothetical protein
VLEQVVGALADDAPHVDHQMGKRAAAVLGPGAPGEGRLGNVLDPGGVAARRATPRSATARSGTLRSG